MEKVQLNDKYLHVLQLFAILATGVILIIFAHQWISPDVVFTSMVAGLGGTIGTRIAANGYRKGPPTDG